MNQSLHEAVKVIKTAILNAQSEVLRNANTSFLSLYYGIGRYVSQNSRKGTWGTGAIDAISNQLQREMPGLRGFGSRNLKNMRSFCEFWSPVLNRQTPSTQMAYGILETTLLRPGNCGSRKGQVSCWGIIITLLKMQQELRRELYGHGSISVRQWEMSTHG